MIAAPHTSNWDFIIGMGATDLMELPIRFTIKKEWMFFPVGSFLDHLGAIPIDRTPKPGIVHKNMVNVMVDLLNEATDDLIIAITPEATRSRREKWKSGFYRVAKRADVPVLLGYIDYAKKECGIKEVIQLTDDTQADMRKIMAFYQTTTAKYPELFSVDLDYL
ncbi:MAG: 1-acyl-sn-glycerol-3-phosphate acyltransferase [Gammaproteobacteria bacterium]|nr:1-acyl-sn-glycerol-3-phosphate acyltransferase [Gammaproteobacteria bacterium]